jgi:hypothetical protein
LGKGLYFILFVSIVIQLSGCGSYSRLFLPSEKRDVKSPWNTFEKVKSAYDQIIVNETSLLDLKNLKFDPFETPNIEIMTYMEIVRYFLPNPSFKKEQLPKEVRDCLDSQKDCRGFQIELEKLETNRFGNVLLDVLNFRRRSRQKGWKFQAMIVIHDNTVVYKRWSGKPNLNETTDRKNPLGPLQNLGGLHNILWP